MGRAERGGDAADVAVRELTTDAPVDRYGAVDRELEAVNRERARLVEAIASGTGAVETLLDALRARDARRKALEAQREASKAQRRLQAMEAARLRQEIETLATSWRTVLMQDPDHARPIVALLLKRRVTITPVPERARRWTVSGNARSPACFPGWSFP